MKHESTYLQQRRERMLVIKPPEEKTVKAIAKKSAKRKIEDKEYKKIKDVMLKENNLCELKTPVCMKIATGLHHKQKRNKFNMTERKNLMRACDPCNSWIEANPIEAAKMNLTISKFSII